MKVVRTKIDVNVGTVSMEFSDIVVYFNFHDALKHPSKDHYVFHAEIIDQIVDGYMFDFDFVFHGRKHSFLSDLHTCHSFVLCRLREIKCVKQGFKGRGMVVIAENCG